MATELHMAQLELDVHALMTDARDHGWIIRRGRGWDDLGHLVHHKLAALFGNHTPRPFRVLQPNTRDRNGRWLQVLGYTAVDAEGLRQQADEFATPAHRAACRLDTLHTKPMPASLFQPGRQLGFELRACPVVRLHASHTIQWPEGPQTFGNRAELDAFFHRRYVKGDKDIDRQTVYVDWLGQRLAHAVGVTLIDASLHAFRRVRVLRRGQRNEGRRKQQVSERPDALLKGTLEVTDGVTFRELLTHGIGRHKGFGFGMLLLRPAG